MLLRVWHSFASSLSEMHFHTSMMTCLGLVFVSLAVSFCIFLREGGLLSGLVLGEVNVESTSGLCHVLRRGLGGICNRVCFQCISGELGT